ncbi:unnamed protein product [Mytilus coruscus]|uniref:Uncharacterized protein n=1 Tax=Mytilus coruscus TaxID=42192 RepID=A0A6J8EMU7_MYTCO|nr:unnamed protein product [Mytilus coruscus]
MKFDEIREIGTELNDSDELSNILDTLKRKQELLRKLDEDIIQDLDQEDIETEIVDSDDYSFNLETKVRQIVKFITVRTSTLNTNATSSTNSRNEVPPSYPTTNNPSSTENQYNTHFRNTTQREGKGTFLHAQSNILLKTAVSQVTSGLQCTDANILFDEGAQRSFITEKLATELKLAITGQETVNLSGFGGHKVEELNFCEIEAAGIASTDNKSGNVKFKDVYEENCFSYHGNRYAAKGALEGGTPYVIGQQKYCTTENGKCH